MNLKTQVVSNLETFAHVAVYDFDSQKWLLPWYLFFLREKGKKCIAHVVCTGVHMERERWNVFKEVVKETIRVKRAESGTAMKREFLGKSRLLPCYQICLL